MHRVLRAFLLSCVLLAGGLNASQETQPKASKDFVNVNLHNIHDLTGPVIRSKTLIHIESSANKPLKEYSIVLPSKDVSKVLSFFQVAQKDSPKATEQPLKLVKDKDGVTYKAVLKQPLGPKESTYLVVNSVYTGMLKPTPQEVAQDERQFLELAGNVYFYSPYESKKQKTTVRLPDAQKPAGLLKEPAPVTRKGNLIVFGPYENIGAFQAAPLYVHFESNKPILVAPKVERFLQVSRWGHNVNFLEYYTILHEGAKLKGHFSRVDYALRPDLHAKTNVLKVLPAFLPYTSTNVFFRDDIGNVSTSHLRYEKKKNRAVLELSPRYPLYGGWKYKWHQGYDVSLDHFSSKVGKDKYLLKIPFVGPVKNLTIQELSLTIALPEGARDIKVDAPFDVEQERKWTYTYLDTMGRPTIVLTRKNVVDEYAGPILITYTFDTWSLLQKPLAVAVALFLVFVTLSVFLRFDFSISKNESSQKEAKLFKWSQEFKKISASLLRVFGDHQKEFEAFKSSKDAEKFKEQDIAAKAAYESLNKQLDTLIEQSKSVDPRFSKLLKTWTTYSNERISKTNNLQSKVVEFLTLESSASVKESKRKELTALVDQVDKEVKGITQKMEYLEEEFDF